MLNRLILIFLTILPASLFAQGLNGGFEAVHAGGIPAGWARILSGGASLTTDAFEGEKAAKAWVMEYYRSGGWISTSKPPAAAGLPTGLTGVYKYVGKPKECDPGKVSVYATRRGPGGTMDTLARGETELLLSKKYRNFELSVATPSGGQAAEFLSVRIEAQGRCDWHIGEECCFLFVDGLEFNEQYAGQLPEADPDAVEKAPVPRQAVTEPVFIQPVRKKYKHRCSSVLKPAKYRIKPVKIRKKDRQSTPVEVESAPIPTEVQREIDRINAAQNDSTPDPASIQQEKEPEKIIEDEFIPDENSYPEDTEDEDDEGLPEEEEDGGDGGE
jgi:hypothetical protein